MSQLYSEYATFLIHNLKTHSKKLETEIEEVPNPEVEVDTAPKELTDPDDWVSVIQASAPWDEGV